MNSLLDRVKECEARLPLDGDGLKWVRRPGGLEPVIERIVPPVAATADAPSMAFLVDGTTLTVAADYYLDYFGKPRHVKYEYSIDLGSEVSTYLFFFHRWDVNSMGLPAYPSDSSLGTGSTTPPLYWCSASTELSGNDALTSAMHRSISLIDSSNHPVGGGFCQWQTLVASIRVHYGTVAWSLSPWSIGACRINGHPPCLWVSESDSYLYYNGGYILGLGAALSASLNTKVWIRGNLKALPSELLLSSTTPTVLASQYVREMGTIRTDADARVTHFRHLDLLAEAARDFY